jgi:hypothetical protein
MKIIIKSYFVPDRERAMLIGRSDPLDQRSNTGCPVQIKNSDVIEFRLNSTICAEQIETWRSMEAESHGCGYLNGSLFT